MVASNTKSKKKNVAAKKAPKTVKNDTAAAKKTKDKAPKKTGKPAKNEKPGIFKRFVNYIKSTIGELKKVNWLSGDELLKCTLVVFGIVAILTLVVWIMDTGLGALTAWLLNL